MANKKPIPTFRQYKIKKETVGNKTGDASSLTVPRDIATKFSNVKFTISFTESQIIFSSGVDISALKKSIDKYSFEDLDIKQKRKEVYG